MMYMLITCSLRSISCAYFQLNDRFFEIRDGVTDVTYAGLKEVVITYRTSIIHMKATVE